MPSQNYANHPHRPVATIAAFFCLIMSVTGYTLCWRGIGVPWSEPLGPAGLIGAVFALIYMSRAYFVRLQTRIIKLEMKVRCATLLSPEQQRTLQGLETPKVVALRFASDEELPLLLDRAVRESLTPDQIKRAVRNWVPDFDRT